MGEEQQNPEQQEPARGGRPTGSGWLVLAALCGFVLVLLGAGALLSFERVDTELTITVWPAGRQSSEPVTRTIRCAGAKAELGPDQAACSLLEQTPLADLQPKPGEVCTLQYGGPEQGRISGELHGMQISEDFSRTNGCEIARWETLEPLLGPPTSVEPAIQY